MTRRSDKIASLMRKEISELLYERINDPRLCGLISITKVDLSGDLKYARIYVSVLGNNVNKPDIQEGLTAATGFIRRELASRLTMRQIPEISFHFDDSIERAFKMMELIDKATSEDEKGVAKSADNDH